MIHLKTEDGFPINIPSSFHGYTFLRMLGNGSTSVVGLVEEKATLELFAAKIISKKDMEERKMIKSIQKEIAVMEELDHPNIVKVHQTFEFDEFIVLICDYCEKGDLLTYATEKGFKSDLQMKKIIRGVLNAVKYLHQRGISHGDIKPENILLDSQFSPKLTDFGYARTTIIAGDEAKNGTLYYAAPELFHHGKFDTIKTDIWAIGITLYSIVELQFPFKDGDQKYIVQQICSCKLSLSPKLDRDLKHLIMKCTEVKPENRPTVEEIIDNKWLDPERMFRNESPQTIKRRNSSMPVNTCENFLY